MINQPKSTHKHINQNKPYLVGKYLPQSENCEVTIPRTVSTVKIFLVCTIKYHMCSN